MARDNMSDPVVIRNGSASSGHEYKGHEKVVQPVTISAGETIYSVGKVARMFGVAARTVSKWIDSGRLHGYRLPRSNTNGTKPVMNGERRIKCTDLVEFCKTSGMPIPAELVGRDKPPYIVIFNLDSQTDINFSEYLPHYKIINTPFDLGFHLGREVHPHLIELALIGDAQGQSIAFQGAEMILKVSPHCEIILCLCPPYTLPYSLANKNYNVKTYNHPVDWERLLRGIR